MENKRLYELYKKGFTPWEWHNAIFKKQKMKIHVFISI